MEIRWKLPCKVVAHISDLGIGSEKNGKTEKLVKVGKFSFYVIVDAKFLRT